MDDEISYHRARAARELNLGLATLSLAAARSHLRLSSLHFERARQLGAAGYPWTHYPPGYDPSAGAETP